MSHGSRFAHAAMRVGLAFAGALAPNGAGLSQAATSRIENALVAVTCDQATGTCTFTHKATGRVFGQFAADRGPGGAAGPARASSPRFGAGQVIERTNRAGDVHRVLVYPDLPFVFLQWTLRNATGADLTRDKVTWPPIRVSGGIPAAAGAVRALGTAGLTAADGHPGSYGTLALADPATRNGVVGGWISFDRADGVVFSSVQDGHVCVTPQAEYGRLVLKPGQTAASEIFILGCFDDVRLGLEQWADQVVAFYGIRLPPKPSGYSTWYDDVHRGNGANDEANLVRATKAGIERLREYGFRFAQIDDGWQAGLTKENGGGPAKDFEHVRMPGPYPSGMKAAAAALQAQGATAGIWYMPFSADYNDPQFAGRQHWFVKDGANPATPYTSGWGGTSLDLTHPDVLDFVSATARRLSREWGYKYLKLDGLYCGMAVYFKYAKAENANRYIPDDLGRAVVHDPLVTPVEAYRNAMKRIARAAGDDVLLVGSTCAQNMRTYGPSIGLVHTMRLGQDRWVGDPTRFGISQSANRYFLNGKIWWNDPDAYYVRNAFPLHKVRLISSFMAVAENFKVLGDWIPDLSEERLDIARRTLPFRRGVARPADLLDEEIARVWLWLHRDHVTDRGVVGLFNWNAKESARIACDLGRLGLEGRARYVGYDFWEKRFLAPFGGAVEASLGPEQCAILSLRKVEPFPVVVGTSLHLLPEPLEVDSDTWDDATRTLSGAIRLVGNDPVEIRVAAPAVAPSWTARKAAVVRSPAPAPISFSQDGSATRLLIQPSASGEHRWSLAFDRP